MTRTRTRTPLALAAVCSLAAAAALAVTNAGDGNQRLQSDADVLGVDSEFAIPVGPRQSPTADATGATDVTAELQSFFDAVPDGGVIEFPAGATYRVEGTLVLRDRSNLTILGNGAMIFAETDGAEATPPDGAWGRQWPRKRAQLVFDGGSGHNVDSLAIRGGNRRGGTAHDAWVPEFEAQHTLEFNGTTDSVVSNCTHSHTYGDGVNVSGGAEDITIRNCVLERIGRQGVAVTKAQGVTIVDNTVRDIRRAAFDLEPNTNAALVEGVTIARNHVDRVRLKFVAAGGRGSVNHVLVEDNVITERTALKIYVKESDGGTRHHWTVRRNTSNIEGSPVAVMRFWRVDHLVIEDNVQPLNVRRSQLGVETWAAENLLVTGNDFVLRTARNATPQGEGKVKRNGDVVPKDLVVGSPEVTSGSGATI